MENKNINFVADLKNLDADGEGVFEGYASTFGNIDSTNDIIEKGAFAQTLKEREPKVLWQHDMKKPVGKLLEAREDEKGLYVKVRLAIKTTLGRDAYEYMKAGIINRLSIGFRTKDATYDTETDIRKITELELFEFSLVTIPANEMAEVTAVKNLPDNERDFEKFLRDSGYTRREAKAIAAKGIKGYQKVLRDAGVLDAPKDALRDADEALKTLSKIQNILKGVKNVGGTKTNSG